MLSHFLSYFSLFFSFSSSRRKNIQIFIHNTAKEGQNVLSLQVSVKTSVLSLKRLVAKRLKKNSISDFSLSWRNKFQVRKCYTKSYYYKTLTVCHHVNVPNFKRSYLNTGIMAHKYCNLQIDFSVTI